MSELINQDQTQTQETNVETQNVETGTVNIGTADTETTQTEQAKQTETTENKPQTVKVKFNHEEKEIPMEEAIQLAQKGMNYDKVHEKYTQLANHPALVYLNEIAEVNGVTVEQLVDYWKAENEQAEIAELAKNNVPLEVAKEILEARKVKAVLQQKQIKQQQTNQMFKELIDSFPELKPEDIPDEVWKEVIQKGKNLLSAYSKYENNKLKEENSKLKQGIDVKAKNQQNASLSTGSVTGDGTIQGAFINKETFEKNKKDQGWVMKNFDAINESRAKW